MKTMNSTAHQPSEITSLVSGCPVCGGPNKQTILDRTEAPIFCNVLYNSREEALRAERGRLQLVYCPDCGMIYNAAFDPHLVTYADDYENAQHFSPRFSQYLGELASHLVAEYNIYDKDVVEIGCGDAQFLTLICQTGRNRGIGFDPAARNSGIAAGESDVTIVPELYTEGAETPSPDFVCCRHVLEHIFDPISFLRSIRRTLKNSPDSHVYFEVPNVLSAVRDLAVWEFLYEHGQYFSESSLSTLFARCGFDVLDISESFGGQFLSLVATPARGKPRRRQVEPVEQQLSDPLVGVFESHYNSTIEFWRDTLQQLFERNKEVAVWGAGTKGVMFLNSVPGGERVHYAVDINPRKHGCYVAGTGQQIISPSEIKKLSLDVVLVMNPVYENEIRTELKSADCHAQVMAV